MFSNGDVAISPTMQFKTIVDVPSEKGKILAQFSTDSFMIGGMSYEYGFRYEHKKMTELTAWLRQEQLIAPTFQ